MLKRQDSLVASGKSDHVIKSSGCMSGIIQLISKYQNKTKRLSSGRKQYGSSPRRASSPPKVIVEHQKDHLKVAIRSPIIQPDNQRTAKQTANNSLEKVKKEPALIGLEESYTAYIRGNESTELKRRKILQALEKCNDDLESIRKIIYSEERVIAMRRSPLCNFAKAKDNGHITQQRKPTQRIKRLGAYEPVDIFHKLTNNEPFHMKSVVTTSPLWCSKAMIQSVEEVCNDIAWGQHREAGRIGLVLQDHICRELIEELIKEMDLVGLRSLLFIACKKRLLC
ncbi:uncharacterized protein LOC132050119 isoform X2 [Lycium ferocissimum]|uniref:uncharacterized protein LOC132050119 isoform X2 n=1 Tax=Lycium ferocissimum TaxID=112874 RepID=UPI0028159CA8|nr:uncharacterized protein LOC132050119 isoform X2 [Lycium ferocissimum]